MSSVSSLLSLLDEPQAELKILALRQLVNVVDEFWHEISEVIEKLEILHNDRSFEQYKLASLLLSKVYFHLGSLDDSLTYAVYAEELFDINSRTEYVETLIGKCIDVYSKNECAFYDDENFFFEYIHIKLEHLFHRLFRRCLDCGEFKTALGLALDSRRLDLFKLAVTKSNNVYEMLTYAYTVSTNLIQNRDFKTEVIRYLAKMYEDLPRTDYVRLCQCLIFLNDEYAVVRVLLFTLLFNEGGGLMSYQIAFDLFDSATQEFLGLVREKLKSRAIKVLSDVVIIVKDKPKFRTDISKLIKILSGRLSIKFHSIFLEQYNKTDRIILAKKIKGYGSFYNMGTFIANGFMYIGTCNYTFLRYNSRLLQKAKHWLKTIMIASLGVINRFHFKTSLELMQNYIDDIVRVSDCKYAKSGYLYALGLIYANRGKRVIIHLVDELKNAVNEEIRHGACLGLGLAAMGTKREDLYEQLKSHLYLDEACTGEAAAIAMGLVMLGSNNNSVIRDMVWYAQECQHEKILRGLSVGIAFVMYGRFEEANTIIDRLEVSSDAILRRSAMYTVAMAYCGTANTKAVRKLLHVAISDVDDDVRRAAVTGLGFLLFKTPEQCPNLVSLLIESYNPHVRYGAAMALGIACAGTGMREALVLLKPIIESDREDFVRQGAFIASAMILIQHNEITCPQVNFFRTSYANALKNVRKKEISLFGAILAQGIINAGGGNLTLSLQSSTGHTNMLAVVGTLMFTQFWYWFPLAHCLSLAFSPTYVIAVNSDLKIQTKLNFKSNVKPGQFAYYSPREIESEEIKPLNSIFEIFPNPARVLKKQLGFMSINEATRYVPIKNISDGGIVMVHDLTPSDEEE